MGVELSLVGSLGPLHMAVELGRTGWQNEEPDAPLHTGLLELGLELTAAIDLDGFRG